MSYDPSAASFGYSAAPNTGYPAQPAMIGGVAGAVPAQDGFYTYEWNPTPAPTFGAPAGPVYEETTVVQSAPTFYGAAPVAPAPAVYETGYYETGCCPGGCQSCGNGCQGCIGGCGCNGCGDGCGAGCGGGCCDGGCLGGCGGCYGGCGGCGQCYGGCCAPAIPGPCHFVISIIFSFFALVAFVFFIVGCATSQWTKNYRVRGGAAVTSAAGQTVNLGLWRFCAGGSESDCTNIDNLNNPNDVPQSGDLWDRLNTVRAFSIIALVTTFFAWIISIVFIFRYNWGLKWSIITLATIGWISGLIAMAVWVSIHKDLSSGDYGYSFGLTTAAWPVLFIVTILLWFVDWGIPIRPMVAAPTYVAPATYAPAPVTYAPAPMQYSYPAPAPMSAGPMAAPTVAVATNYASY